MRARVSTIGFAVGVFIGLAAISPGQGLAQIYRPQGFDRAEMSPQLELEFQLQDSLRRVQKERQAESWTMFGRLGMVGVENQPGGPDDGFTFSRSGGPRLGRLSFGIRRRF